MNSALVSYTRISPNSYGKAGEKDRITPHHVVGQATVESLGVLFANPKKQGASNYGIGKDGRIGLYVQEDEGAMTSNSRANDMRAVTIECADDPNPPYAFSNTVYNRLIELCADICKRHGKKKLLWIPNKTMALAYQPKTDEMLLTMHQWFVATACPGTWMIQHMEDLANKVTERLSGNVSPSVIAPVQQPATSVTKTVWDYLLARIGNEYGAAGMMGNIEAESGFKVNNLQNSYERTLGMSDAQYTEAVDNGTYTNFVGDKAGYGLCQWTSSGRKQGLLNLAKTRGKSVSDLSTQLDWLWTELQNSYKAVMNTLKSATSVRQASDMVLKRFESPRDQGQSVQEYRAAAGQRYYEQYAKGKTDQVADGKGDDVPTKGYVVRITAGELNVREGPGTNHPIVRTVRKGEAFTIVQTSGEWGFLKSGVGWICLKYTEKV